jgi:glycerate kinase
MKIVIAPDSYKGSLGAGQVANALAAGILRAEPATEIVRLPVADGGEGTVGVMLDACGGRALEEQVEDPLGRTCDATWGVLPDGRTAIIELAAASGLVRLSESEQNPLITSSYGTGQLIEAARRHGCNRILVGIGGSATVDGGAGILQAVGAQLMSQSGSSINRGGGGLPDLDRIDASVTARRFSEIEIVVLCDVENPLIGTEGAAAVFGPQKGASPQMVKELEAALTHYAAVVERDLGIQIAHTPRCGAAGGAGAALYAAVQARLERGIEAILGAIALRTHLADADLVITGEGKMDSQTLQWKAPYGVAKVAAEEGVPVLAVVGDAAPDLPKAITSLYTDVVRLRGESEPVVEAMANTEKRLQAAGEAAARSLR